MITVKLKIYFDSGQFATGAKNLQVQCAGVIYLPKSLSIRAITEIYIISSIKNRLSGRIICIIYKTWKIKNAELYYAYHTPPNITRLSRLQKFFPGFIPKWAVILISKIFWKFIERQRM